MGSQISRGHELVHAEVKMIQKQVTETKQEAQKAKDDTKALKTEVENLKKQHGGQFDAERKTTVKENDGIASRISKLEKAVAALQKQCKKK